MGLLQLSSSAELQLPPAAVVWHVDPVTIKIAPNRTAAFPSSRAVVDIASMRGECERVQLWLYTKSSSGTPSSKSSNAAAGSVVGSQLVNVTLAFEDLTSTGASASLSNDTWSYKQQGYVWTVPPGPGGPSWQARRGHSASPANQCSAVFLAFCSSVSSVL